MPTGALPVFYTPSCTSVPSVVFLGAVSATCPVFCSRFVAPPFPRFAACELWTQRKNPGSPPPLEGVVMTIVSVLSGSDDAKHELKRPRGGRVQCLLQNAESLSSGPLCRECRKRSSLHYCGSFPFSKARFTFTLVHFGLLFCFALPRGVLIALF